MTLRTPLHDWHVAHGARMVDFAGWQMPLQYSSIVEEHQAVRTAAGLFDISHMGRLSFAGGGSLDLLQSLFTNNVATMRDGQVRYGLLCNKRGGILDDVLVYRWPYGFAMVVNAANRSKIITWLEEHKGGRSVDIIDQTMDTGMVAVQGPQALTLCRELTSTDLESLRYYFASPSQYNGIPCVVSRTGYTGEDGLEIMIDVDKVEELWQDLVGRGARPCGLGARDTLRLEAGMPLYGHELTEEIDPFQAGLAWAVKMDKGDFLGREALARREQDPTLKRRVGLELEGKRIAREGAKVVRENREIGLVTSGTFSPTLNKAIAMAYVEPAYGLPGTACAVDIRGKAVPAKLVSLPFYKRAKA